MKNKRLYINGLTNEKYREIYVYISDMITDDEIEMSKYYSHSELYDMELTCTDKIKSINISMDDEEITIHIESKKYDTLFSLKYNEYISIKM